MPNRLAKETSPYLLQHKDNPVDWYPWGEDAFAKARAEDKPILLSVGYSSCHWCHVMAHESFEEEATAGLMNRWFVNVKVDREERPDIDGIYMTAVQAITGQGGWPMTVFLDHEARPFYAGTYFPPTDGHGRPGFGRVLEALHEAWENEREQLLSSAEGITDQLRALSRRTGGRGAVELSREGAAGAVQSFRAAFDGEWGGFGHAPKFPTAGNLEFLLAFAVRAGADEEPAPSAAHMALATLVRMASGGMYDHLGGGFSRYSVDRYWLVPHFEKMLYDNAQLARVYMHAYQLTGDEYYGRVARETLAYLEREMLDGEGGFYSAQDADSEGIEGKYFVWTPAEVRAALGGEADLFNSWFGVTEEGNFRDPHHPEFGTRNVLATWQPSEQVAARFGMTTDELAVRVAQLRSRMLGVREERVRPGLDDKVLASWNGLALAAFAEAARVFGEDHYREVALANAAFVREQMWRHGRLLHTYSRGVAKVEGMIDDYAYYGLGLVELFRATGDLAHLAWARELFELLLRDFRDSDDGGFFETAAGGEQLLLRQKSYFDEATPSGNGAAALLALWLARYYGRGEWEEVAVEVLGQAQELMRQAPTGFGALWQAYEFLLAPAREIAIVGPAAARRAFERAVGGRFLPWVVVAPSDGGEGLPLFEGRGFGGETLAYVCEDMVCGLPARTPDELARQLRGETTA